MPATTISRSSSASAMPSSMAMRRSGKMASKMASPALSKRRPLQDRSQPSSSTSPSYTSHPRIVGAVGCSKKVFKPSAAPPRSSSSRRKTHVSRAASPPSSSSSSASTSSRRSASPRSSLPSSASPSAIVVSTEGRGVEAARADKVNITIPQRLPTPPLEVISSPYTDLAAHLRRHGLERDAQAVEESGMPCEYLLDVYLTAGQLGKSSLHQQTHSFVPRLQNQIASQVTQGAQLPRSLKLDVTPESCGSYLPPTHVLAIYSSTEEATLVAAHDMVLALQCTSIPFLPPASRTDKLSETSLPVVPLCIPHPSEFGVVHKWLYSPNSTSVYQDLIPMTFVVRLLSTLPSEASYKVERASSLLLDALIEAPLKVSLALSYLATGTLLGILKRIQAVWKNGAAMGISSRRYWNQLDKAWEAVVAALVTAKKRKAVAAAAAAAAAPSVDDMAKELGCAAI